MSACVKHILTELKRLNRMSRVDRKRYIKVCRNSIVHCICECVKNLLKGHLPLKPRHLKILARHKQTLRKLALKKTSLKKRKQILQKGGFLPVLLKPLLLGLGALASNFVTNAVS